MRRNRFDRNVHRSLLSRARPSVETMENGTLLTLRSGKAHRLLVLGTVLSTFVAAQLATASFVTAPTYSAGPNPQSVAVGDFNGDGIPDLVVANDHYPNSTVSILLGNGDGTFQAAKSFAAGASATFVAVADFNGDGRLDLAVANPPVVATDTSTVSILLGNGDGTFQAAQSYAVGGHPASVAAGDFNGDGQLDLAVVGSQLSVLLGNGDGTFQAAQHSYGGLGNAVAGSGSVAVGDFNADGKLDLAVTGDPGVLVLLGRGDGTFQPPQSFVTSNVSVFVAVGDFNADGLPDLAVANLSYNTVSILLGKGDGSFQDAQSYTVGSSPIALAVADLNGDGLPDLAVVNQHSENVLVLLGNGDGTFQVSPVSYTVGSVPASVAVADLNGDGHFDLAVANSALGGENPSVSILLGKGDATFQAAPLCYPVGAIAQHMAVGDSNGNVVVGDFNGDGITDLVVVTAGSSFGTAGTVSLLLGKGDGTFRTAQTIVTVPGGGLTAVAVGDFNRDGHLDLAVTNSPFNTVSILLGNGDGTFQAAQSYAVGGGPTFVAVGDFNGDGLPDLVVTNGGISPPPVGTTVTILLGNGDGTFQGGQNYTVDGGPTSVAVGDFNGDGISDLAVVNGGNGNPFAHGSTVTILLGKGDGTFEAARTFDAGYGPNFIAVADLNGDGKLDIVTSNYIIPYTPRQGPHVFGNEVRVFLGNGDGTFQAAHTYQAGTQPEAVVVGDFNGDGVPDLAVANSAFYPNGPSLSILLGNGDGTFRTAQSYQAGGSPFSLAVGDFNGDGHPDLAVANNDDFLGFVTILLNAADW